MHLNRLLGLLCTILFFATWSMACGGSSGSSGTGDIDASPGGGDGGTGGDTDSGMGGDGGTGGDGGMGSDGGTVAVMSITGVQPPAVSRAVDAAAVVTGANIPADATLILTNCDDDTVVYDLSDSLAVSQDGGSINVMVAADPARVQGLYTVTVTAPDGQSDRLECAFSILAQQPPTVTNVVPDTAFAGVSGDGTSSDTVVTISGTGFESTPGVRWVKTDGTATFEALFVGFGSSTELTTVVPSESRAMLPGDYHVFVINPDLLGAQWMVPDGAGGLMPGIFRITPVPAPRIDDLVPARVPNPACLTTTITVTGAGFDPGVTTWWVAPAGTACTGAQTDPNGQVLCPMAVASYQDAGTVDIQFSECPPLGAWPIRLINPDGQSDTFFNVEVRNNNDGHLDASPFITLPPRLNVPRFKHGADFGFDVFGNAYIYAGGGQDADGAVIGSTEFSQLDVFGNAGPFEVAQQYLNATTPRAMNSLGTPRQGAALVRVGRSLFMIGGADRATDVVGQVDALSGVERAEILGFDQMPAVRQPVGQGPDGLPRGSWYYQISAIGPWGESLASREVVAANTGGAVEVCWNDPLAGGATSFNVYRSLAADGRANTAAAIAFEVAGNCFTDNGADQLAPGPGNLRGTPSASAGLAAGDHTYRVSALVTLSDGATFETHGSYAATVEITPDDVAAGNGAVTLNWGAVAGAEYLVYRRDSASQRFRLLAGGPVAATTFTDDGAGFDPADQSPRPEIRPLPSGSLSRWDDVSVPALNTPREGLDGVVVAMDPATSGGLVARILVAGGRTANVTGSYLTTAESLGVLEDGSLEASWFDEAPQFTTARAFYALVTTQNRNVTPFPPDPEEPPCGDLDGDGAISCDCAPLGTPPEMLDCNDADPGVHPGATEICGDGIDQDCDMGCTGEDLPCECSDDADGDGHVSLLCGGDDCCDSAADTSLGCTAATAPGIHPGATEACGNGVDEDCDGVDPMCECMDDLDGDGHISIQCGGDDCCDTGADTSLGCTDNTAPNINPSQREICENGIDDDCNGSEAVCLIGWDDELAMSATSQITDSAFSALLDPIDTQEVDADEPVYVLAALGDDEFATDNRNSLSSFEACLVDDITGHLACSQWQLQGSTTPQASFAMDALLYFEFLYPFYGLSSENVSTGSRQLINASISRFPLNDPATVVNNQIIGGRQSANVSPLVVRGYYKALRLVSYIYLIGGITDAGVTGTVERHLQ